MEYVLQNEAQNAPWRSAMRGYVKSKFCCECFYSMPDGRPVICNLCNTAEFYVENRCSPCDVCPYRNLDTHTLFELSLLVRELKLNQESILSEDEKNSVPLWKKSNLTLEEAAAYSGIGTAKLRQLADEKNCSFILWNGSKRLIKRKLLDKYLESEFSI